MTQVGWLTLAALTAASAAAQTPAPSPSQQQTFRTSTIVVEVDASVTNGKNQFATGLTADDFEVLEDGSPQKIQRVYLVTGNTVTGTGEPAPVSAEAPVPLAPPPAVAPPRVFVLLFDQDHLQAGAFKRLQEAALAFLNKEFKQGDVGGVVIGNTMAGNQLTSDHEALLTAVRNAKPTAAKTARRVEALDWPRFNSDAEAIRIALSNDSTVLAQVVRRACDDDPDICKKYDPTPDVMNKARTIVGELRLPARRTVMTLQALASGLARLPGRKNIILMTEGFFVEESWADLRQIVGAAARSNVRIYSLDGRGLDTRQLNDLHQMSVMDAGGGMPLEAYNTIEDGPNALSNDTGGYSIRRTNDFTGALSEIARDASNYYVISYSPSNATLDGSFRKIAVRVKRSGLTVRARRGYLATPAPTISSSPAPAGPPAPSAAVPPDAPPAVAPEPKPAAVASLPGSPVPSIGVPATPPAAVATHEPSGFALRPDTTERVRELASLGGSPETNPSLASQGWDRYQKGDLEGAAELLGKAAANPDAHPWVHYALGYSALGLRHPERAAPEWEKVRAAVPEFEPVYLDLADAYGQMENFGAAIDVLKKAQARWPEDTDVLNAIGTLQVRRGALDEAVKTFRRATEVKPADALAYFNLARTYQLRYFKTRRYSSTEARWMANASDIKNALANYEQYLKLGGPYEVEARRAVQNLQWVR